MLNRKEAVKNEYMRRFWIANQAIKIITDNYDVLTQSAKALKKDGYLLAKVDSKLVMPRDVTSQLEDGTAVKLIHSSISGGYSSLELRLRARENNSYFDFIVYLGSLFYSKETYNYQANEPIEYKSLEDILSQIESYKPNQDLTEVYTNMDKREQLKEALSSLEAKMPYYARND